MELTEGMASYRRQLYAENKSDQTIERVYLPRLRGFHAFLKLRGMPTTTEGIRREHTERYILYLQTEAEGRKDRSRPGLMPASVSIAFRTLRVLFMGRPRGSPEGLAGREDARPPDPGGTRADPA